MQINSTSAMFMQSVRLSSRLSLAEVLSTSAQHIDEFLIKFREFLSGNIELYELFTVIV